jgi:hypothetical protein
MKIFVEQYILLYLHTSKMVKHGALAERLGSGLQHHLQRFESARHLVTNPYSIIV